MDLTTETTVRVRSFTQIDLPNERTQHILNWTISRETLNIPRIDKYRTESRHSEGNPARY